MAKEIEQDHKDQEYHNKNWTQDGCHMSVGLIFKKETRKEFQSKVSCTEA